MEEERDGVSDRFSGLPEDVVHHILSFLDTKNVIRTSTLSKTFMSFWRSFPVLDFSWFDVRGTMSSEDEFINYVNRICSSRHDGTNTNVLEKFRLAVEGPLPKDRFDRALTFAAGIRVNHLSLSVGSWPPYLLPNIISFPESVTKITLENFHLEYNLLIRSCPLLEELELKSCRLKGGSNFPSTNGVIKSCNLVQCTGLGGFGIKSPSLEVFGFHGEPSRLKNGYEPFFIYFSCDFLKELSFQEAQFLTDSFFENLVPQLVLLETLTLRHCYKISRLEVCNDNLKRIKLRYCNKLEIIVVRVANLESFNYVGQAKHIRRLDIRACKHLKRLKFDGSGIPCGIPCEEVLEQVSTLLELGHLKLGFDSLANYAIEINHRNLRSLVIINDRGWCSNIKINTPRLVSFSYGGAPIHFESVHPETILNINLSMYSPFPAICYFLKLLEFVKLLCPCKLLTLTTSHVWDLIFRQDVRKTQTGPLINLKHMKVIKTWEGTIRKELVDSLLWLSPYLETLIFVSIHSGHKLLSIQFEYGKPNNKVDCRSECTNPLTECLSLKTVHIKNFEPDVQKDSLMKYFMEKAKSVYWK